jgi:hypothetical protein
MFTKYLKKQKQYLFAPGLEPIRNSSNTSKFITSRYYQIYRRKYKAYYPISLYSGYITRIECLNFRSGGLLDDLNGVVVRYTDC